MNPLDRRFRLANEHGSLGLSCLDTGVSLAGVPLLRITAMGFAPRPAREIEVLIKSAYGPDILTTDLSSGLGVIAEALNRGDLGRAMAASLHLRELDWDGAARIAHAEEALNKYNFNPDEPRDRRGRWTTDGQTSADGFG